jgi:hypothetical protein
MFATVRSFNLGIVALPIRAVEINLHPLRAMTLISRIKFRKREKWIHKAPERLHGLHITKPYRSGSSRWFEAIANKALW